MYIPKYASISDPKLLESFIKDHSFGTLISDAGKNANHYPFLVTEEKNKLILWTHFAKTNPQWQDVDGKECLVIFTGPHAYISPVYYTHELNVPTWNYTAVHANCKASVISDPILEKELMKELVTVYETKNQTNWDYQLPEDFHENLLKAIVWIKFEVKSLDGKFKLSQNRDQADYERVVEFLEKSHSANDKELVKYMKLTKPF